jgi:putative acetyltransferase
MPERPACDPSSIFKGKIRRVAAVDNLTVRRERRDERPVISAINIAAFGRPDEARLVDRLHHEGAVLASFVAEVDAQVVGHILFSRMSIETPDVRLAAVALAPMAVKPEQQRRGVGSQLIRDGLAWLRARGEHIVVVLGHPDYYARFGFSTDRAHALASPSRPRPSWRWNWCPALSTVFAAPSDIRLRSASSEHRYAWSHRHRCLFR